MLDPAEFNATRIALRGKLSPTFEAKSVGKEVEIVTFQSMQPPLDLPWRAKSVGGALSHPGNPASPSADMVSDLATKPLNNGKAEIDMAPMIQQTMVKGIFL